ncbi:hypothetical protein EJP77_08460 [Paenibacillus zeisoli]|uniref:Uncharacterized protein n=1 Tax=Paenibacillus zeisoli TaxID=2496267 RepID=A0A3S1DZC7_9BACL|nr:hypothetical protein [Paenibacillus zeisoli]RUT33658.1 hypothetical protein EJP77_08460 [Paenibacillus zeisoli]
MRKSTLGLERAREGLSLVERFLEQLEHNQPERHFRNAMKEWLLASRAVIDSAIDTLEEEPSSPTETARKIPISKD